MTSNYKYIKQTTLLLLNWKIWAKSFCMQTVQINYYEQYFIKLINYSLSMSLFT